MAIEKYSTLLPQKSPKRILKGKLLTALGATGVLSPYPQNPERILENKILRKMPFVPAGGVTPPPPITSLFTGLMAYWKLDDMALGAIVTGTTTADATGNGNTLTATSDGNLSSVAGKINNGINSIGGGGGRYFSIPDNAQIACGLGVSFSCSIWANYVGANYPGTLFTKCENLVDIPAGNGEFRLYQTNTAQDSNLLHWLIWDSTGTVWDIGRVATYITNQWNHFVLTFDATTNFARTYVNGVLDSSLFLSSNVLRTTFPLNLFDSNNSFRNGYGSIDEAGFWHVALPPALVTRLYNGGAGLPFGSFT